MDNRRQGLLEEEEDASLPPHDDVAVCDLRESNEVIATLALTLPAG